MRRFLYVPPVRSRSLQIAFGLLLPIAATLLGKALPKTTTAGAAMYYLLAVVVAAFVGRFWGSLVTSFGSFLGLNFFFTPPFGTFNVAKFEDLIALFVFLVVASLVATLLTEVLEQRTRAERRERETHLLYQLSSGLLSRQQLDAVLGQVARDLTDLFDLESCEVKLVENDGIGGHQMPRGEEEGGHFTDIELKTEAHDYGVLRLHPKQDRLLSSVERDLARAFATQVALAVEAARLDDETRQARAEAEVSRIRAALFSSVTHDLKTPLSSVKAAASSLLEEGVEFDSERRSELLRTIVEETDRLNRLISNLLQLSRLRAGVLLPRKTATPIRDVIESVLSRLGRVFESQEVGIQVRVRDDPPSLPMDVLQVDQALSNILENAARYAPPGTDIRIDVRKWQSWVEVNVVDKGPGIPSEEREKVFEEFYRSESGDSKGSAGLGLAIVRAIVSAHGGSAWTAETPGGGATIGFRLPLSQGEELGG